MLMKRCEAQINILYQQQDYDFMVCFKEIDTYTSGYLTSTNIQIFLNNVGVHSPEAHKYFFQRFSPYNRDRISIGDFRRFFDVYASGITGKETKNPRTVQSSISKPSTSANSQSISNLGARGKSSTTTSKHNSRKGPGSARTQTSNKHTTNSFGHKETHKQKVFNMMILHGQQKVTGQGEGAANQESSSNSSVPLYKNLAEQRIHLDFLQHNKRKHMLLKNFSHDSRLLSKNHWNKRAYYEVEFLKTFEKIAELNRNLSRVQNDVALREDFSPLCLFRHFDKRGKGIIGLPEMEIGLGEIAMLPQRNDICLMMKTFDANSKARLDFSDFCKMVAPRDDVFRNMMAERMEQHRPDDVEKYGLIRTLSADTFTALQSLFDGILTYCVCLEALRQRLTAMVGTDLHQAFYNIPKSHGSLLSAKDVDRLCRQRSLTLPHKEIIDLIRFFDMDSDGKLSYAEFCKGFSPVMGIKYHH